MSGVEYTVGSSGWCEVRVFSNATVSAASPRTPSGISFANRFSPKRNEPMILQNHWPEPSFPRRLCSCDRIAPQVDPVQCLPQRTSGILRRIQCCIGSFRMRRNPLFEQPTPYARMVYVRFRVQREITTSLIVGPVHLAQALLFFRRNPGNLRLVCVERSQRLFGQSFARDTLEVPNQLTNLRHRAVPLQVAR